MGNTSGSKGTRMSLHLNYERGGRCSNCGGRFARKISSMFVKLESEFYVATPSGEVLNCKEVLKGCAMTIANRELGADLVIMYMYDFDVILVMDWLSTHHVMVKCFEKEVVFQPPNEAEFCFVGARVQSLPRVMISLQAKKLLQKGCVGFLANMFKAKKEESQMQDISVVRDYAYMFPDDIQGLLE
ncbi:unnamed protein product [Prunus armeniaca]|uniref:Uncharacterized protein n=1 Tax=Prunus armeniaca TaxID=36596 RepID=A0A6J5XX90_PRUAR|nr:unnamed protein product [Prunus armeniaca]